MKELGVETANLKSWGMRDTKRNSVSFNCVCDKSVRMFALFGNGPWLPDESLRALQGMPELRSIRFDHNGNVNHPRSSLHSGVGCDVLVNSRLIDVRLTLGMTHAGMEQAAKIKGLKSFGTLHSPVRDGGVKYFEGHPTLEAFTVSKMGNVSLTALSSIAKMPKVEQVGLHEAFVTDDGGFKHCLWMKGRIKTLDLSMSLINTADLQRVRADHPNAPIITIPPAEIVKRHRFVASRIARIATGAPAEQLKQAIAEHEGNKKSSMQRYRDGWPERQHRQGDPKQEFRQF